MISDISYLIYMLVSLLFVAAALSQAETLVQHGLPLTRRQAVEIELAQQIRPLSVDQRGNSDRFLAWLSRSGMDEAALARGSLSHSELQELRCQHTDQQRLLAIAAPELSAGQHDELLLRTWNEAALAAAYRRLVKADTPLSAAARADLIAKGSSGETARTLKDQLWHEVPFLTAAESSRLWAEFAQAAVMAVARVTGQRLQAALARELSQSADAPLGTNAARVRGSCLSSAISGPMPTYRQAQAYGFTEEYLAKALVVALRSRSVAQLRAMPGSNPPK